MKYVYKLGANAVSFTDSNLGISITRNNPYTSDKALHKLNPAFHRAMKGGQIVLDILTESIDLNVATASAEELNTLTVNEITSKFDFLDEADSTELKNISRKADKIAFLIKVREDYELD